MLGSGGSSKKVIQDAINAALAQLSTDANFSYKTVISSQTLTIPQYQQMIVSGEQTIEGEQVVDGEVVIIGGEQEVTTTNPAATDAFGRQRVSTPLSLFEGQLTYDLQPLLFEQLTNGSGAAIAHNTTDRNADFTLSSTPTGGYAIMQTYEWFHYRPGKSQIVFITANFVEHKADTVKFAGLSDGNNGFEFFSNGSALGVRIFSDSNVGDQTELQSNWNIDPLDGSGESGLTLNIAKHQIMVVDFQALYAGRVRFGFDIGGCVYYCHEFNNANIQAHPYIQSANLPIRVGMTCTGTVSTTMEFTCCSVQSEAGSNGLVGYNFVAEGTVTASSGARTHLLSVRPKTTFNSITNRTTFVLEHVNIAVTGSFPVKWELVLGQAISGTTTFNDVNTTYSSNEFNTAGTISGSPTIVIDSGYVPASTQSKGADQIAQSIRYPITLSAAGAVRSLGTISLIVTGIGGTSACRGSIHWRENR